MFFNILAEPKELAIEFYFKLEDLYLAHQTEISFILFIVEGE